MSRVDEGALGVAADFLHDEGELVVIDQGLGERLVVIDPPWLYTAIVRNLHARPEEAIGGAPAADGAKQQARGMRHVGCGMRHAARGTRHAAVGASSRVSVGRYVPRYVPLPAVTYRYVPSPRVPVGRWEHRAHNAPLN